MGTKTITDVLAKLDGDLVLLDIGASGQPPVIWNSLSKHSIYIGFDPDRRKMITTSSGKFKKQIIINKAVTTNSKQTKIKFYFTKFPPCSSTLEPDTIPLQNYIFYDYFTVSRTGTVVSITLNKVLKSLNLESFDWIKIDSQGTDLRLFKSLPAKVRSQVVALDIEPGLISAYQKEDYFAKAHEWLTKNGFWLADANIKGITRINAQTQDFLRKNLNDAAFNQMSDTLRQRKSPGWVEARYLRTTLWLKQNRLPFEKYLQLWLFAMIDKQIGFALDTAISYEHVFGQNPLSRELIRLSMNEVKSPRTRLSARLAKFEYTLRSTVFKSLHP